MVSTCERTITQARQEAVETVSGETVRPVGKNTYRFTNDTNGYLAMTSSEVAFFPPIRSEWYLRGKWGIYYVYQRKM